LSIAALHAAVLAQPRLATVIIRERPMPTKRAATTSDRVREPGTAPATVSAAPDISHMQMCIEDVRQSALDGDQGPADPLDFGNLRGRLEAARSKFPPLYRQEFVDPYIAAMDQLGAQGFATILIQDPQRRRAAGLVLDMAHAILQRGEQFQLRAANAFQEMVGDLYDGFLSAEDREGVNPPDLGTTPPLIKWGNPRSGPYTWGGDATRVFGARAGVVSLPPANARKGLLAWSALPHEAAGHDILHADNGLQNQLAAAVRTSLQDMGDGLAEYWSSRIDETASDVLGILNMGPAAGIGLVGFFRGFNKAFSGVAKLRGSGPAGDPHPADVVRGYLAAEVVALLPFTQHAAWSSIIASETDADATAINLAGVSLSKAKARESAKRVAAAIVNTRMPSLEEHALGSIQTWRDSDEDKVGIVRQALTTAGDVPDQGSSGIFATHVVAAAVIEALANGADIPVIFERMISILAGMHAENPVWGPLFVRHPGDIQQHRIYIPQLHVIANA
jgi:hypothetical protein